MTIGIQPGKPSRKAPNLRLAKLRFNAGLSQRHLASLAGVSASVVQMAEKGWVPHPGNAHALLEVLSLRLDEPVRYVDVWPPKGRGRS